MNLTQRQADVLAFLKEREAAGEPCPSFDEMKARIGLTSKSGIFRLITALEERGKIRRIANRARAIEVLPDSTDGGYRRGYRDGFSDGRAGRLAVVR